MRRGLAPTQAGQHVGSIQRADQLRLFLQVAAVGFHISQHTQRPAAPSRPGCTDGGFRPRAPDRAGWPLPPPVVAAPDRSDCAPRRGRRLVWQPGRPATCSGRPALAVPLWRSDEPGSPHRAIASVPGLRRPAGAAGAVGRRSGRRTPPRARFRDESEPDPPPEPEIAGRPGSSRASAVSSSSRPAVR